MKKWRRDLIIIASLFFLAFLPRINRLSEVPIYPDEITWMVRSKEISLALRTLNFDFFSNAWWNGKDVTESIALPLTVTVGFPIIYLAKGQSVLSYNLFQDYVVGRWVVIILTSGFLGGYYLFAKKYYDKKVALISSLLLLADPIFTANSRIIMNDIFLTIFMFISLFSYLLIDNGRASVLLASFGLVAAFLTKPQAILLLPLFFLQILLNKKKGKLELRKFAYVSALFVVLVTIFWPSSWTRPLLAIPEYIYRQFTLAGSGINNYFFGKISDNAPFYYYLFQLVTRIPPLILLGFAGSIFVFIKNKEFRTDKNATTIYAFIFIFLFAVSVPSQKLGVRYILPLWPFIYLLAGKTIYLFVGKVKNSFLRYGSLVIVVIYSFYLTMSYFPYEDLYYNIFIGGTKNAQKYDLVGLCSGSKAAIDYVGKCFPEVKKVAALGCGNVTIPYYYPYPFNYNWKNENVVIIENHYLQLEKDKEVVEFYNNNIPTHTINIKGANLAHIYVRGGVKSICQ